MFLISKHKGPGALGHSPATGKAKRKSNGGFSLMEILVVLGIFVILTSVVLARQNRFSSDILLTDMAYQVAISIRQAQVYGLGVRGAGSEDYDTGYGLHFSGAVPLKSYTFFPDIDKNAAADETELKAAGATSYQLPKGKISQVCARAGGAKTCLGDNRVSSLDLVYIRPSPAAHIMDNNGDTYEDMVITVTSLLGDRTKCVVAYQSGQVSVIPTTASVNPCNQ